MDNKILLKDGEGKEVEMTILFTYFSEEFNQDYVFVYEENDAEEKEVLVFKYDEENNALNEIDLDSDKEWAMIDEVFNAFINEENEEDFEE